MSNEISSITLERFSAPEVSTSRPQPKDLEERKPSPTKKTKTEPKPTEVLTDCVKLVRDEQSGRQIVQVLDRKTGEIILQIPPEEIQKLSKIIRETYGAVVDTHA